MTARNGRETGRDALTGRFARGNRLGGRRRGSRDRASCLAELVADYALATDSDGRTRVEAALDAVYADSPVDFLRLVVRMVPPTADDAVRPTALTLSALVAVLDSAEPAPVRDVQADGPATPTALPP